MRYQDNALIFAPTDLSRWSASPYASWMARFAIECPDKAVDKDAPDALLSRLAHKGLAHEDALEAHFRKAGLTVVNVAAESSTNASHAAKHIDAVGRTLELLQAGVDVVAQATLERDSFRGHADFLVKVPGTSALGDFHYEVWDTKLARRVKPGMVLQLCCYADMLEAVQQRHAHDIVIALGDGRQERVSLVDCFDYYRAIKQAFLIDQDAWAPTPQPDPADHANHGEWAGFAQQQLEASDHLGRVARITRRQVERLSQAGITTMTALSEASGKVVPGIDATKLDWLVRQAALQCASASKDTPDYHVHQPQPEDEKGLAVLPDASPLDVYFDIEGFPLEGDGLEYLWGCAYLDEQGERAFRDWWAHDVRAERRAFEGFIDWVHARWREDPGMHVYHYAPYETTACKRLMGTHGTREQELDDLLRGGVFVDLYSIVTHGLQIGEPHYSIKNVERLYRPKRDTDVASGGDSVVVYDLWREAYARGEESGDWQESEVLATLREYNRDDCDSTLELCEWLRARRGEVRADVVHKEQESTELTDTVVARHALRERLLERADDDTLVDAERTLLETLAGLPEFHRREDKNAWWRLFDRLDPANTALAEDAACLANCRRTAREGFKHTPRVRNLCWEYTFDTNQEFKGIGKSVYLKGTDKGDGYPWSASVIHTESNVQAGLVVVQCKQEPPALISLLPNEIVGADPIPAAIDTVVGEIESGQIQQSAILDLLRRNPPRFRDGRTGPVVQSPDSALEDTVRAVLDLDDSCLVIQGPPGAGKSYTGARIIAALVAKGCRVGIASNSHTAIDNLFLGALYHCKDQDISGHFVRGKHTNDAFDALGVTVVASAKLVDEVRPGCVVGTTAWGFAREDLEDAFDVLIVDEAGQVALANLVAMSRAARNLVVMGDQRQLGQPTQGSHPAESGLSVLDYRLGDAAAVAPEHGVFLGVTYRMHPAVNAPISRHVYADQLRTASVTSTRTLLASDNGSSLDREAGIVFVPVEHEGNQQESAEEVDAIVAAVQALCKRQIMLKDGSTRTVTLDDMLFVAPYNAQAARLSEALEQALGVGARVGSVDRFQGQEAPIVFLSLCSSDATGSPRGIGFLFDQRRLNVAVSRAESLCVIVGHPRLAVTPVATLADLKRVNFVAALMAAGEPCGALS